jgi:inosine/xanthosine triphosphate pyrophosphatase family protein
MQIVLATNNKDKIKEIQHLLDDLPVTVLTRDDFLEFPDPEETGGTLEDNISIRRFQLHLSRKQREASEDAEESNRK